MRLGGVALEENAILLETLQVVALGQVTIKVAAVLRLSPFPLQAQTPMSSVEVAVVSVEAPVEVVVVAELGRVLAAEALPLVAAFLALEADPPLANKTLAGV